MAVQHERHVAQIIDQRVQRIGRVVVIDNGGGEAKFPDAIECPGRLAHGKRLRTSVLERGLQLCHELIDSGLDDEDRVSSQGITHNEK